MTDALLWISDVCDCGVNDAYGLLYAGILVAFALFIFLVWRFA